MRIILSIVLLLFLSACSIIRNVEEDNVKTVILKNDESEYKQNFTHTDKILRILNPDTPLYLNSRAILYITEDISGTYAYHFWGDLPSNFYRFILSSKLEKSGIFKNIIGANTKLNADYALESRLDDFEQILNRDENYVKIAISMNLVDLQKDKIIAHRYFTKRQDIPKKDVLVTFKAFEKALNSLNDDIVFWINSVLTQK